MDSLCNPKHSGCVDLHAYMCIIIFIKLEALDGRIFKNEKEFLISPFPGTKYAVRGLTYQQCMPDNAPVLNFGKRPFDWMTEEQWQSLLVGTIVYCTLVSVV